jgi:hypothetical protein
MAMTHIVEYPRKYADRYVAVHSDSQAALSALSSSLVRSKQVREVMGLISAAQNVCKVSLHWVKGHANVTGNEYADCLAKQGNEQVLQTATPVVPLSGSQVKNAINREFHGRWQKSWSARTDLVHTRAMIPIIDSRASKQMLQYNRQDLQLLTQIITGHCLLGRHVSKWREISSICRLCCEGLESPHHLLEECPALTLEQMQLCERVRAGTGSNIEAAWLHFFKEDRVVRLLYKEDEDD